MISIGVMLAHAHALLLRNLQAEEKCGSMRKRTQWPRLQRVSSPTRDEVRLLNESSRRDDSSNAATGSAANKSRFGINCRFVRARRATRGRVRFRHGAVTLLYWNSTARVLAFIGSCIPSAINLNSSKSTPRFYIRIDAIPVCVIGVYVALLRIFVTITSAISHSSKFGLCFL